MENIIVTDDLVCPGNECFVRLAIGLQNNEIKIFIDDAVHSIEFYRGLPIHGKGLGDVLTEHVAQMIWCYIQELNIFYNNKKDTLPDEAYEIDQAHTIVTLQARNYFFEQCVYYFGLELAQVINADPVVGADNADGDDIN